MLDLQGEELVGEKDPCLTAQEEQMDRDTASIVLYTIMGIPIIVMMAYTAWQIGNALAATRAPEGKRRGIDNGREVRQRSGRVSPSLNKPARLLPPGPGLHPLFLIAGTLRGKDPRPVGTEIQNVTGTGTPSYPLPPATFHSMREAQDLAYRLENSLAGNHVSSASIHVQLVELFSELVNNAAEHGMSAGGASAHVRHVPHRSGHAFDLVVVDTGPGILTTLGSNPSLGRVQSESQAVGLAIQALVSGTGAPGRGMGLWMTMNEMRRPGRMLQLQSGDGLLTCYGAGDPELRGTAHRQGVMARLVIPC